MFKLYLEKAEEPEIKLPNVHWIIKKAREFQENIYFLFIEYNKDFDCVDFDSVDHKKLWETLKEMRIPNHFPCILRNFYTH